MKAGKMCWAKAQPTSIPCGDKSLKGFLCIPQNNKGLILFAHGSGSGRLSKRNQFVAKTLNDQSYATLLFDLLTEEEEYEDSYSFQFRFDIPLLSSRLATVTLWCVEQCHPETNIGYFGASTGAAAAIIAASQLPDQIKAVVSRGGRPDLAKDALFDLKAPTLLIVGLNDETVIELNQNAMENMHCIKKLELVEGATHLFEEPGKLEIVSQLAKDWFDKYL